jgi:glutaredoxin
MKRITIYTGKSCAPCKLAKGYMDINDIPYTEIDIEDDASNVPENVKSVPTIICDDDERLEIIGFSQGIGKKIKRWYYDKPCS